MVGSVDVENETYIIDQTNKENNGKVIHVSYKLSDIKESNKSTSISMDDIDGETTSLQTTVSSSDTLTTSSTTYTIDFLPAYGPDFNNLFSEPETEISSMVNEINDDAYSAAGVTLEITSYKQFSDILQGTTSEILHFFEDEIPEYRDITNSDLAFLFYGKNFEDDTIGRADSYNGDDSQAHGVAQMIANPFGCYSADYQDRCLLTAHETGHNFGCEHDEAYQWTTPNLNHYTTMWSPFSDNTSEYMELEFSSDDNHGDEDHDNLGIIIQNKDVVASYR
ncbi:M12 family metallo-peptidase [Methanohalobium sp.]|uniref:M12 family metallo-peptidase n=1 Tax=Methanohalobium sp. TaxID=2837493 RepID=UPI0025D8A32A|nr:M12 family metallo-peptidase [Methanohalobium sp.]